MSTQYNIAVVGATGVVGQELIKILEERKVPVGELRPLASARSAGKTVKFNDTHIEVQELTPDSFNGIDYALFSAGGAISEEFCPHAVKAGTVCIDNTSHFRMDPTVPLVVPEVNAADAHKHNGIIANPNCSTAQLVVALKPIYDEVGIARLVISTYQSVSGAGNEAIFELEEQSRALLNGQELAPEQFPHPIAFNAIPHIDKFTENGYTKEEMKMVGETKKIMGDDTIAVTATCVRIPVFICHSESVNIKTRKKISAARVRELLQAAPGVEVVDDVANNVYPLPRAVSGKNDVQVGRIRDDISQENGIELWCVGDNLRKGAALNAIQILEELIK
ncbi:MAG: aspartate-semialdehyde dehydrogenase [bacterium]|nr:aspartate-semialdehyde dehydrogenase [bacterium]